MTYLFASRSLRALLTVVALASAGIAHAQQVLRVTAIPDESPTELARKFAPLGKYLESRLGMKVEWTPVTDTPPRSRRSSTRRSIWPGSAASHSCRRRCARAAR